MNAPKSRTMLIEFGSNIPTSTAEVPNNGQPSPVLTIPSQGSPINSNDTVQTHAQPSTSDSHSSQSLWNEFSHDVNWNFDLDLEGILLPPGDIKNVLDLQKFSWPVLGANDDCNFDFDVPFTADVLGTANVETPVSTLNNECTSYSKSLSNSLNSAEEPEDLVKLLNINGKVRSFSWDEVGPAGDSCTDHDPKLAAKGFLGQCYYRH